MEDVQTAIANVMSGADKPKTLDTAIERLALCANFPSYFKDNVILELFVGICAWEDHPTAKQLEPFQNKLDLIAHIMSGRVIFFMRPPLRGSALAGKIEDGSWSFDRTKAKVLEMIRKQPGSA